VDKFVQTKGSQKAMAIQKGLNVHEETKVWD